MDQDSGVNKTGIAVSVFDKNAELYAKKYEDVTKYHKGLDVFSQKLSKIEPYVLELACGPGNLTQYILSSNPDIRLLATDLAPNMLKIAATKNPGAQFQLLDCREIKSLDQEFDGIVCGFVLPYLSGDETQSFFNDSFKVLNSDGLIYLSTMEDDNSKSGWETGSTGDKVYINYHEGDFLIRALEKAGFELVYEERINYIPGTAYNTTDLILIASKK